MLTSKVAELEECANSNAQSVESQARQEAANFQQQIANLKTKFMQERTGMVIEVLFCLLLVKKIMKLHGGQICHTSPMRILFSHVPSPDLPPFDLRHLKGNLS